MSENITTELLREIRDLLRVMAEPAIANRDKKLRASLREIVGDSKKRQKAVLLMNGSKSQAAIGKESELDSGNLSRLVKSLRDSDLMVKDSGSPSLAIAIPSNFFDMTGSNNG